MLHLRNEILEHRVRDIADEQIALACAWRARRCSSGFGVSGTIRRIFGVSGTDVKGIRGFRYRRAEIRGFRCRTSGFQVPGFGVSGARISGFQVPGSKIYEARTGG